MVGDDVLVLSKYGLGLTVTDNHPQIWPFWFLTVRESTARTLQIGIVSFVVTLTDLGVLADASIETTASCYAN